MAAERGEDTLPSAPPLEVEEGIGGGEFQPSVGDACSICMDAKKDAILIDCGHRATCMNCAQMYVPNPHKCSQMFRYGCGYHLCFSDR